MHHICFAASEYGNYSTCANFREEESDRGQNIPQIGTELSLWYITSSELQFPKHFGQILFPQLNSGAENSGKKCQRGLVSLKATPVNSGRQFIFAIGVMS